MRFLNFTGWVALSLTLTGPAAADPEPPAIWYRASEACPSGTQFLDKLTENSRRARLAQAGDHIDFVVTLVADPNETLGRLERQTDSGVVAIRELRDATCSEVADALALSLGLALSPGPSKAEPASAGSGDAPGPASGAPVDGTPGPNPPASAPDTGSTAGLVTTVTLQATPTKLDATPQNPSPGWSVGMELGAMIGTTTHPLPRGQLFLDFMPALQHFLPKLSVRAGVVGSLGSSATAIGPVQRWILAGRAEACPVAWIEGRFDLRPCAAFELGADKASVEGEAGRNDHALWAAPGAQLRLALVVPKIVRLEVGGGAVIPLIRKEILSGAQSLYRDAPVVFHAGLDVSLRLP